MSHYSMKENTNFYWTSKKPILGLRHFVLINKININSKIVCQLVSVIDSEISLKVFESDLTNQNEWHLGWLDLSKRESITKKYFELKSNQKNQNKIERLFLSEDSIFNIS